MHRRELIRRRSSRQSQTGPPSDCHCAVQTSIVDECLPGINGNHRIGGRERHFQSPENGGLNLSEPESRQKELVIHEQGVDIADARPGNPYFGIPAYSRYPDHAEAHLFELLYLSLDRTKVARLEARKLT